MPTLRMRVDAGTIADLARALRARRITSEAATEQCLERIAERDRLINAFITVLAEDARAQARAADLELAAGRDRGPLHGVPISLKDVIDLRGTPTTAASRVRRDHVAEADAPAVARLREAGAVFIGKTNLHEFAFGTTNEDSAFGAVHHPLDSRRSPGGSSGGSAASVLAGMAFGSIGTDTGGSIRIPAAACGLVGLKPSLGEIATGGVVPLSATMDHVGPLGRSVEDVAILHHALLGTQDVDTPAPDTRRLTLGVPREYFFDVLDDQVAMRFGEALDRLCRAGVTLKDVVVPHAREIAAVYLHVMLPEAAACHARTLDRQPDDYTPNVRLRLEMARYILAEDYVRAMRGREVLTREVDAALAGCDALVLPALAVPATRLGATTVALAGSEQPIRNLMLRLTQLFNITGHPAMSLPCGLTSDGLPAGAQLVGRRDRTTLLLRTASALEPLVTPDARQA
jgi:aspartyl-tRNA(Asn)/glutamyl-tRNA(Gln) amidotransferase subunit A